MRIFFSVGEPSGDLHGSNLIHRLKSQVPDIECVGFGGPKMHEAGCKLHFELTSMAVMFIAEALKNLRFFFRLVDQANTYFEEHQVDAVVLIDFPGFNWWIARKAKKHGIPVFYYGVPQMWAWAPWRVRKIRRFVDHVLCKLPFEVEWFAQRKCHATYVGHPYFDQLKTQTYDEAFLTEQRQWNGQRLTLLPGSRDQEVRNVLPILLKAAKQAVEQIDDCQVAIACFNDRQKAIAEAMVDEVGIPVSIWVGKTPELMKTADVCLACSGSVSMELLHYRKPTVIVYRTKKWVMAAQAILLRTKFITLVNLIAATEIRKKTFAPYDPDQENADPVVMPEYLTSGDPSAKVARWVVKWLTDSNALRDKIAEMDALATQFARPGATDRAADYILKDLGVTIGENSPLSEMDPDNILPATNELNRDRPAA